VSRSDGVYGSRFESGGHREVATGAGLASSVPIEVTVIRSRDAIDQLADRIERAYLRRNPGWTDQDRDREVWDSAASRLLSVSSRRPNLPIDPELFVAVLTPGRNAPDPWAELTLPAARTRYLKAVRRIVGRLRRELESELKLAGCRLRGGMALDDLLDDGEDRISPLTRYILAYRSNRYDLILRFMGMAQAQHRSCPLYLQASRTLLPGRAYPARLVGDTGTVGLKSYPFSRN
jgi:hypothetical protein